jgi:prepilin-type N-terminal cleavage/methylation domain-containing protein
MKKKYNKGFTLIELIIVMVLLGILAAVAVPRMSNTIRSAEEAAEQKFMGNLVSALEVYAGDQVVENSEKSYPNDPFDALENKPDENVWKVVGDKIQHYRNGYDEYGGNDQDELQEWIYYNYAPGSGNCYSDADNMIQSLHGCYTLTGPGFGNMDYSYGN